MSTGSGEKSPSNSRPCASPRGSEAGVESDVEDGVAGPSVLLTCGLRLDSWGTANRGTTKGEQSPEFPARNSTIGITRRTVRPRSPEGQRHADPWDCLSTTLNPDLRVATARITSRPEGSSST